LVAAAVAAVESMWEIEKAQAAAGQVVLLTAGQKQMQLAQLAQVALAVRN
jgi:hypothetical protein